MFKSGFYLSVSLIFLTFFSLRALAFDVDQCLNDVKKVEVGVSCLFGSSNADCLQNYREVFVSEDAKRKDFWVKALPGKVAYPDPSSDVASQKFSIPGGTFMEEYFGYAYQVGITPPSYVLDALLIARYGVWFGGAASWAVYLVASFLPTKGFNYICDNTQNVQNVASNPVCSKSVLRPQIYQILKMNPQDRYEALTNPNSDFYGKREALCGKYFGTLAQNLDRMYQLPIGKCSAPSFQRFHEREQEVQKFEFDGREHTIADHAIWWENDPRHVAQYVLAPVDAPSQRRFRLMSMLYYPSFRDERIALALRQSLSEAHSKGYLGTRTVSDDTVGVPPTDEHMAIWLNRPRIYEACGLTQ